MTQSTAVDATHDDAAIARWDDEGGASTLRLGSISNQRWAAVASWLVPPVVVPVFFAALIIVGGVYRHFQ